MPTTTRKVPISFITSTRSCKNTCAEIRIRIYCMLLIGYTRLKSPCARAMSHMTRPPEIHRKPTHIYGFASMSTKNRTIVPTSLRLCIFIVFVLFLKSVWPTAPKISAINTSSTILIIVYAFRLRLFCSAKKNTRRG